MEHKTRFWKKHSSCTYTLKVKILQSKTNLKCFGSNETKGSQQRSQIRLLLSMPEGEP